MSKHTPGPWKAVQHPREHKWAWTIEGTDGVGQIIARVGLVNDAQAVAANAHLIAAAPAMYEALKAIQAWSFGQPWPRRELKQFTDIDAALAQAEGVHHE